MVVVHDAEADQVAHAQLAWPPGGGLMLGSARPPGADDPWPQQPGTFGGYVVTDKPDELFARAVAAGATVPREPFDTDYGSRDFTAVGCDLAQGFYISRPTARLPVWRAPSVLPQ